MRCEVLEVGMLAVHLEEGWGEETTENIVLYRWQDPNNTAGPLLVKLPKGTVVRKLVGNSNTPYWAYAVEVIELPAGYTTSASGVELHQIYFVSKKFYDRGVRACTEPTQDLIVERLDGLKSGERVLPQLPIVLPVFPKTDRSYTYAAAQEFVRESIFDLRLLRHKEFEDRFWPIRRTAESLQSVNTEKMTPFTVVPDTVVIHHTSNEDGLQAIQNKHLNRSEDYGDVGYHFLIANDPELGWRIFQGRSLKYQGAHAFGANDRSIGIAIQGNYQPFGIGNWDGKWNADEYELQPPPEAVFMLGLLLRAIREYFPDVKNFAVHRNAGTTSTVCPGDGCIPVLQVLAQKLELNWIESQSHWAKIMELQRVRSKRTLDEQRIQLGRR